MAEPPGEPTTLVTHRAEPGGPAPKRVGVAGGW